MVYPDVLIESGFEADHTFESGRRPAVYLEAMNRTKDDPDSFGVSYAGAFKT